MAHQDFLRTLQLSVKNVAELSAAQRFSHPIYENFYKDVCSYLSKSQRESYERIYQMIEAANRMFDEQSECAKVFCFSPTDEQQIWWRTMAKFQYFNIREIDYLIGYHLKNPEHPAIEFGKISHREYLKHDQFIHNEIAKILEGAKEIDPKDAFVRYHRDWFSDINDGDSDSDNEETPPITA